MMFVSPMTVNLHVDQTATKFFEHLLSDAHVRRFSQDAEPEVAWCGTLASIYAGVSYLMSAATLSQ